MAQIEQAVGHSVPLKWLFQAPTIAGLATFLEQVTEQTAPGPTLPPSHSSTLPTLELHPDAHHEPFPLTDIQQAYWLGRSQAFELGNVATHGYREIETVGLSVAQVEGGVAIANPASSHVAGGDHARRAAADSAGGAALRDSGDGSAGKWAPAQVETALAAMRDRLSHELHDVEQWPLFYGGSGSALGGTGALLRRL